MKLCALVRIVNYGIGEVYEKKVKQQFYELKWPVSAIFYI